MRLRDGVAHRLLATGGAPVLVRAWQGRDGAVALRAEPAPGARPDADGPAGADRLAWAIERMRFALGVDVDLDPFYEEFRADPLIGPVIRVRPWLRPKRNPTPWESLAWAVTEQLIESQRAAAIQRRMVRALGRRCGVLRDSPDAAAVAAAGPAELVALDLAEKRAIAMRTCARQVRDGFIHLDDREAAATRLLAIPEIGPWTVQCLGLFGQGHPDDLPAGDLAYIKLVGRLAGLDRRATVEEVEEFFAPYAPFRGLAGMFALNGHHRRIAEGPPLRLAA